MGVSKNNGTPKWMVYNGKPYLKWIIWGYHHFWKHLYISTVIFHFSLMNLWMVGYDSTHPRAPAGSARLLAYKTYAFALSVRNPGTSDVWICWIPEKAMVRHHWCHTVSGRNPANQLIGGFSPLFTRLFTSQMGRRISSIKSMHGDNWRAMSSWST